MTIIYLYENDKIYNKINETLAQRTDIRLDLFNQHYKSIAIIYLSSSHVHAHLQTLPDQNMTMHFLSMHYISQNNGLSPLEPLWSLS